MNCTRLFSTAPASALLLVALASSPSPAQVVRGQVVQQEDGTPVAYATVLLSHTRRNVNARAVTDSSGRFRARLSLRGEYDVFVGRVDSWTNTGRRLAVMREDTFTVLVQVPREVISLPALNVVASTRSRRLESVGYYRRSLSGSGTYIGPARIRARHWINTSRLLSSVTVRTMINERNPFSTFAFDAFAEFRPSDAFGELYGTCVPTFFVNGTRYGPAYADLVDQVSPEEIEGVEIYHNSWSAPLEYTAMSSFCGAILVWLRA